MPTASDLVGDRGINWFLGKNLRVSAFKGIKETLFTEQLDEPCVCALD